MEWYGMSWPGKAGRNNGAKQNRHQIWVIWIKQRRMTYPILPGFGGCRLFCASIHGARFCSALVAANVSPKGASVHPAKGEALVSGRTKSLLFPVTSGPTGQEFIFNATDCWLRGQSGELLARWAEHHKTLHNITRGAADVPGLRPSLDDRGREAALVCGPPPSEPDGRISRIRLSG